MEKRNQVFKVKYSLTLKDSLRKANIFLKTMADFKYGYIYIKCPNVSYLFIVFDSRIRLCSDKEWTAYYHMYLYPEKNSFMEELNARKELI